MVIDGRGGDSMLGCSLHEAFPDTATESGKVARKEEKRKAQKCRGPALAFLKASGEIPAGQMPGSGSPLDPDRQHLQPLPPAETLQGSEGFQEKNTQFRPVKLTDSEEEERALVKDLIGQRVDDVIGQTSRKTIPRAATRAAELPDMSRTMYGDKVPAYFGKSEADEGFADFSSSLKDNPGYTLTPKGEGADFLKSFQTRGLDKASGTLTSPSIQDAWKPLTPSGARSSFFEYLPAPSGIQAQGTEREFIQKEELVKKLDLLFARLDDLESREIGSANIEITLFIMSGLFLLFGLETLRKF